MTDGSEQRQPPSRKYEEIPEVTNYEFKAYKDGNLIRIPLVVERPEITGKQIRECEDIDQVIPKVLEQCGFRMEPRNIASSERVLMFLVMHLVGTGRFDNVWKRLVKRKIDPAIASNQVWINATTVVDGMIKFKPTFWRNLLECIECDVNPEVWKINRTLATFYQLAINFGIDPTARMLALMVMRAIAEVNLGAVMDDPGFCEYLYRHPIDPSIAKRHVSTIRSMRYPTKPEDVDDLEDGWVIMLATSRFRRWPFSPISIDSGMIPVLTSYIKREEERAIALQRDAARRAELARDANLLVGAQKSNAAEAAEVDEHCGDKKKDGVRDQSTVIVVVATASSECVARPYVPYTCLVGSATSPGCTSAALLAAIDALEKPVGTSAKRDLLFTATTTGKLSGLRSDYCAAIGESVAINPTVLFRSMVVCMLGGEDWVATHAVMLPSLKRLTDPQAARNVLGLMTPEMIVEFMGAFDLEGVRSVSLETSTHLAKLSGMIENTFTADAFANAGRDMIKMILVIFYTQWDHAVTTKRVPKLAFDYVWRDMFKWAYDAKLKAKIDECRATCPILPSCIRAQAIKLAFADV